MFLFKIGLEKVPKIVPKMVISWVTVKMHRIHDVLVLIYPVGYNPVSRNKPTQSDKKKRSSTRLPTVATLGLHAELMERLSFDSAPESHELRNIVSETSGKNREIPGGDSHPGCDWHPGLGVDPSLKQKLTSMETFKFLGEFQPLDFLGVWVVNRFITSGSCEKSVQKFFKGIDVDKFVHLSLSQIILIFAPQPKVNHWVNTSRERAFQGLGKRLWRSKGASPGEFRVTSYNEKNQGTGDKILFTSR